MKKRYQLVSAVAVALAGSRAALAQVLYEPFDYTSGATLSSTSPSGANFNLQGTYWAQRGGANLTVQNQNFTGATYMTGSNPVLPTGLGLSTRSTTTGTGEYATLGFGEYFNSAGDIYWSALVKPNSLPSSQNGSFVAGLASFSLPTTAVPSTRQLTLALRQSSSDSTKYNVGLGAGQNSSGTTIAAWSAQNYSIGDTLFVVAHLKVNTPGVDDDQLELWVNPTANFGATAAALSSQASAYLSGRSTADLNDSLNPRNPAHSGFFVRGAVGGTGGPFIDEVRVDSTWAGVTPDGNLQFTWTGGGSGNLSDASWSKTGAQPANNPNGLGHVANLNSAVSLTTAGEQLDTINLRNGGSTIGGTGLTMRSNASAAQVNAYSGNHTVSAPITMANDLAVKANGGASLTFSGAISGTGKSLLKFGQGNVVFATNDMIAHDANLEVRAGAIDLAGNTIQVDRFVLGVAHSNVASGLGGPDNSPGTVNSSVAGGTLIANTLDLRSGTINVPLGGVNLVKNNAATITLTQANNYTGTTTVNSGTLQISDETQLGPAPGATDSNKIRIAGGATLRTTASMTLDSKRGINMIGTSPGILNVATGTTLAYNGVVNGTGGLTQTGGGTLILGGANTYAGATNVVGGTGGSTLRIAADDALPVTTVLGLNGVAAGGTATFDMGDASNAGFNQTLAGIITNSFLGTPTITNSGTAIKTLTVNNTAASLAQFPIAGNLSIVKSNTGVLVLNGANTYAGTTTVSAGALVIGRADAIPGGYTTPTNTFTINAGAAFGPRIGGDGSLTSLTASDLTTIQQDATIFNAPDKHLAVEVTAVSTTSSAPASVSYGTAIADLGGNSRGLFKYGVGTLVLTADNTYTGPTGVNAGTLQASKPGALPNFGTAGKVSVAGGATLALNYNGSGEWTSANVDTLRANASFAAGSALGLDTTNGGTASTYSSNISGPQGLRKLGTNQLVLSGTNTYSGATSIAAGSLSVGASGNLGDGSATNSIEFTGTSSLVLTGSLGTMSRNIATTNGISASTGNATTTTATIDTGTFNHTFSGVLSGDGRFVKAGTGSLTLTGENTYAGRMTVSAGALRVTSSAGLGTAAGDTFIAGGSGGSTAVLELDGAAAPGGGIALYDDYTINGKSATSVNHFRNVSGNNSILGTIEFTTGGSNYILRSDAGNLTVFNFTNPLGDTTVRAMFLRGAGTGEITGTVSGSTTSADTLTKLDAGTWTLSGINSYTGATTVSAGVLALKSNLLTSPTITVAGGKLRMEPDGGNFAIKATTFATPGGQIDVGDHKLIVTGGAAASTLAGSTYGGVAGLIQQGYANGAWSANGIVTSQSSASAGQHLTALGWAAASDTAFGGATLFAGQSVAAGDLLVMYTYAGDANLDGKLNGDDYFFIDSAIASPTPTINWHNGDFNYDGKINGDDYFLLDANIGRQSSGAFATSDGFAAAAAGSVNGITAVPEPASFGIVLAAACGLAARRRRRRTA
jgi:autotransporter-associated beta strand protein